jgi:chromosome segregation ATPase
MTDEQEHELMAANEQLAQARDTIEESRHKEAQIRSQMAEVEAREVALKGKFDQCVHLSYM